MYWSMLAAAYARSNGRGNPKTMGSTSSINLLGSAIDVGSIVDNLIYVDSAPVRQLQSGVTTLQNKVSAFQSLNTKFSSLSDKLDGLLFGDTQAPLLDPASFNDWLSNSAFSKCKATSSDDAKISVTTSNATPATYSIAVSALAKAKSMVSANFSASNSNTGDGAITITKGGQEYSVTIDSSDTSLSHVCNAINNLNAGVTATIINDGSSSPYRLVIAANDVGTNNAFDFETTGNLTDALGITTSQQAVDAQFTLNGVSFSKSSNSVSDAVSGITLTLNALTTSPVTIKVEKDADAIVKSLQDFIAAYNDINTYVNGQFTYNSTTKKAGVLSGDATLRYIQNNMQTNLTKMVSNQFTNYSAASQVGFGFNRDGSLSLDETKFRSALTSNTTSVAALFLGDSTPGVLSNLRSILTGITDPLSGPIHNSTDAFNQNIKSLNDQISDYQDRLNKEKELLTNQFNKADQALRLLTVTQASLSGQIAKL
jgi:flagellar hook-associated protein 2